MPDLPNKPVETPMRPTEHPPEEPARRVEVAPEFPESPEEAPTSLEDEDVPLEAISEPEELARRPAPAAARTAVSTKDPVTQEIENVMAEDLTDVFLKMTPQKQAEFKAKGEETAGAIRQMLASAKVNARKVFELVRDWLKLIPGVNRFFLEQEAKIKTDKILILKE